MQFVGMDGEGIDEKYALIQDSEDGELMSLDGLATVRVFEWFFKRASELAAIDPVFVGYVTTYDVNMILRDVDDATLLAIFSNDDKDFVKWRDYEILYIPRKILKLRKRSKDANNPARRDGVFTLYDVFTFFGGSFVRACEGFIGSVPREIERGKAERGKFSKRDLPKIRRYNKLEVKWLVKLCERLQAIFEGQGIYLKKWHGPGAVAEYVLGKRMMNAHADYPVLREWHAPRGLWEAWDCAYYGGRFENMGIGTFRNVFSYDINSAYPFALSQLCKLNYASEWKKQERPRAPEHGPQAVYLVEWDFPEGAPFGPFPWRDHQHRIFYPLNGLGWYWQPEVSAAFQAYRSFIKLHQVWYQETGGPSVFQTEIPRLYQLRNQLKKQGNPGEYALKIALNSIYGKLAQRVGLSPFRCIPFAGWITSHSRALLLSASMEKPKSVLAFATDSVFSNEKLSLCCSTNLGDWKRERADNLLILMNGFYRLDEQTRTRKSATRGLPKIAEDGTGITWEDIIEGLNKKQEFSYPFTQFVTHSMALHFPNEYGKSRLRFIQNEKTLRPFEGTRRIFDAYKLRNWERGHVLSRPIRFPSVELSHPSALEYASVTIEEEEENA